MKKVFTALLLIAAILLAGVAESKAVRGAADSVLALAELAEGAQGGELYERCKAASDEWTSKKRTLELFLSHCELDEADLAAVRMTEYASVGDIPDARSSLREFQTLLSALRTSEELSIYNLL